MKLHFLTAVESPLATADPAFLDRIKEEALLGASVELATDPAEADVIVIHEATSFKEWRYINKLCDDPVVGKFPHKIYTINTDDSAAGLLRGLYTSLSSRRLDPQIHRAVPYASVLNERVIERASEPPAEKKFLASWRGNTKSNSLRKQLVAQFVHDSRFRIEATDSWFNHDANEKDAYVDLLRASKFSLCPAGWAAVSFRIYESMALGIAPVIIADDFVPPAGPDWPSFAIICGTHELDRLPALLEAKEKAHTELGRNARMAWDKFFSPPLIHDYYADRLLDCISNAPIGSREAEIARWRSFKMRWTNRWTLPQRVANKLLRAR